MIRERKLRMVRGSYWPKKIDHHEQNSRKKALECNDSFKYSKAELERIIFDRVKDSFEVSDFYKEKVFLFLFNNLEPYILY